MPPCLFVIVGIPRVLATEYFTSCLIHHLWLFFICPSRSIFCPCLTPERLTPMNCVTLVPFATSFHLGTANGWHRRSEGRRRAGFYYLCSSLCALSHKICMNNKQACHTLQTLPWPRRWVNLLFPFFHNTYGLIFLLFLPWTFKICPFMFFSSLLYLLVKHNFKNHFSKIYIEE